jgi:hypothetical protein
LPPLPPGVGPIEKFADISSTPQGKFLEGGSFDDQGNLWFVGIGTGWISYLQPDGKLVPVVNCNPPPEIGQTCEPQGTRWKDGKLYLATSFGWFLAAGLMALLMRSELANPGMQLKPEMFANVEIITDINSAAVSVPQSAVLDDSGKKIVFVADGQTYKQRQVQLGIESGNRIEIIDGLRSGERVVVKGNYLLLQQARPEQ